MRELVNNKELSDYRRQEEEELFGNQDARGMLRDLNAAMTENASGVVRFGFSTQVLLVADDDPGVANARAATIIERLHKEAVAALASPAVATRFQELGITPVGSTPEEFRAFVASETARWGEVARRADIRVE